MSIIYLFDTDGAFLAGDTETEATAYAYPTSIHATTAKRNPEKVANEMTRQTHYTNQFCPKDIVDRANARNWSKLHSDDAAVRRLSKLRQMED